MKKQLKIKIIRLKRRSRDKVSKLIVVGYNTSKVNGRYIEKLGAMYIQGENRHVLLRIRRIAFWLNKGAIVNSKVAYYLGLVAQSYRNSKC